MQNLKYCFVALVLLQLTAGHVLAEDQNCDKARLLEDADMYEMGHFKSQISGQLKKDSCVDVELNMPSEQLWSVLTHKLERRWIKKELLKCDSTCPNIEGKNYPEVSKSESN